MKVARKPANAIFGSADFLKDFQIRARMQCFVVVARFGDMVPVFRGPSERQAGTCSRGGLLSLLVRVFREVSSCKRPRATKAFFPNREGLFRYSTGSCMGLRRSGLAKRTCKDNARTET